MDPYAIGLPVTTTIAAVRQAYPDLAVDTATGEHVGLAGRVIFARNTGKLCFATLRAGDGTEIQAMLSLAKVGEQQLAEWKDLVDIGDHVFVAGEVITSKRGELSVLADEWRMAAKSLRPLPVAHKPMSEEARVRQRYVDLITRPEAQQMARTRVAVVGSIRQSLSRRGYLEIETPMLQTMHGGATARPFVTHSNAFDLDVFLRIAPELFLKRAVVADLERVFEVNRNFRNEGADRTHSPSSRCSSSTRPTRTTRSWPRSPANSSRRRRSRRADRWSSRIRRVDPRSLRRVAAGRPLRVVVDRRSARRSRPPRTMRRLVELCDADGIDVAPTWVAGKLVEELFEHHVISSFTRPDLRRGLSRRHVPLVRGHRSKPGVVEKWDLYVDGFETGTGYSELVDPVVQRDRLVEQAALAARGDVEAMHLDEDFLRALEFGMPPSGGVGIGVDRLLMPLTGLGIRETILFPLVKPERGQ